MTRQEVIDSIKLNILTEKISLEDLKLINAEDFDSAEEVLRFIRLNKDFVNKQTDRCMQNMKRDLDL